MTAKVIHLADARVQQIRRIRSALQRYDTTGDDRPFVLQSEDKSAVLVMSITGEANFALTKQQARELGLDLIREAQRLGHGG